MGHIYDNHGRFAIEGRRESFYIHADYGLKPAEKSLGEVGLGKRFRRLDGSGPCYVTTHELGGVTRARPKTQTEELVLELSSGERVIPLDTNNEPEDQMDDGHPLGRLWREHPHPEIEISDLDDLIAALEDYREKVKA